MDATGAAPRWPRPHRAAQRRRRARSPRPRDSRHQGASHCRDGDGRESDGKHHQADDRRPVIAKVSRRCIEGGVEEDRRDEQGQCELGQDGERRRAWNEREGCPAEREKHGIRRAHASRDSRQDGGSENKTNQDFEFFHVPKRAGVARLAERAVEHTANPIALGCFADVLALSVTIGKLRAPLEQQLQDRLLAACAPPPNQSLRVPSVEPQDAAASSRLHSAAEDRRRRPAAPVPPQGSGFGRLGAEGRLPSGRPRADRHRSTRGTRSWRPGLPDSRDCHLTRSAAAVLLVYCARRHRRRAGSAARRSGDETRPQRREARCRRHTHSGGCRRGKSRPHVASSRQLSAAVVARSGVLVRIRANRRRRARWR